MAYRHIAGTMQGGICHGYWAAIDERGPLQGGEHHRIVGLVHFIGNRDQEAFGAGTLFADALDVLNLDRVGSLCNAEVMGRGYLPT